MFIINLPLDIQNTILSYLYFSKHTYLNILPSLILIKNYETIVYYELETFFSLDELNKLILRFLNIDINKNIYDKLMSYNVEVDYENYTKNQIINIFGKLNIIEINMIYIYITGKK